MSLTSVVCKLMERIVKDVILDHLIGNQLISKCQHGFIPNKGCVTNLLETMDFISENIHTKKAVDIVYMDFCKAFDKVPHRRLIYKLKRYGLSEELVNWIKAFLTNRRQRVVLGNECSSWKEVLSGVPQGSVLGPILFVIYINDLPDNIRNVCKLFADDTKVASVVDDQEKTLNLQTDISTLYSWSKQWLMEFNEEKCVVVHYGTENAKCEYYLGESGHKLVKSKKERDLGVIFSDELKNSTHVAAATKKANQVLGLIKRSFRTREPNTIKKLYTSLVRPHLEYAVQVWNPFHKKDIATIEGVQRRATKMIGQLRNVNYEDRLNKLNLTSLEERRARGDLIEQFKIVSNFDLIEWHYPLSRISEHYNTRSHSYGFVKQLVRNNMFRFNFFTNRVTNSWNALPREVVEQNTINGFKNKLDSFLKNNKNFFKGYYSATNTCAPLKNDE